MNPTTPFGAALRYYRKKENNLTQGKLGRIIGISQAMVSKIEKGLDDGSADSREKIANYFKVPYSDFLELGKQKLEPAHPATQNQTPINKDDIKLKRENDLLNTVVALQNDKISNLEKKIAELETAALGEAHQSKAASG